MSTDAVSEAPVRASRKKSLPSPILSDVPDASEQSQSSPTPQKVYVARKPLVIQGTKYKPGDEIPFAHEILRIEGWIRAGYLNEVWR